MNYILIGIGIFLIAVNAMKIIKNEAGFNGIFKFKSKEPEECAIKLMELRREFTEKIIELEMEIESIKLKLAERENQEDIKKAKEVKKLINDGLTVDMIAEQLKSSREEIILLKDLY